MYLSRFDIHRFRNLESTALKFKNHKIFFFGDNAQGKTNLIEAIYVLCLARSFRTREDVELVPFDIDDYLIEGEFTDDVDITHRIGVYFSTTSGKKIKVDGKRLGQLSSLVGRFPVVKLSSDDHVITDGPPAERRRFFNLLLSQCFGRYLEDLKEYERILKQRNNILGQITAGRKASIDQLAVWNVQLIRSGTALIRARARIVEDLNPHLHTYYRKICDTAETLKVTYGPNVFSDGRTDITSVFTHMLEKNRVREIRRGLTLTGPHRDEFLFTIDNRDVRKYGSRGEHKSALLSLKAAEIRLLGEKTETNPILLLDDLYAELDKGRGKNILCLFNQNSQTFITGTSLDFEVIKDICGNEKDRSFYFVRDGKVGYVIDE